MPHPITSQQREFLKLIIPHLGPDRTVRFMKLREAGVPEETARIFESDSDYLDSLVNRRLQQLRNAGWVEMDDSLITVLHDP